jgi:putative protein-disulfide isomerase
MRDSNGTSAELVYIGDPLCSWCWGFAPSLRLAREAFASKLRFTILVGGLRTGDAAHPLGEPLRGYLRQAWREVEKRSGQPFDFAFLDRDGFLYDTEPACRAVVTARRLRPDTFFAFDYNETLQDAFYRRGMDPTAMQTFLDVASELGLDQGEFRRTFEDLDTLRETRSDFEAARSLGAAGFPTTLLRLAGRSAPLIVARGWLPPQELLHAVENLTSGAR